MFRPAVSSRTKPGFMYGVSLLFCLALTMDVQNAEETEEIDICYHKRNKQTLSCSLNERLQIVKLLQRKAKSNICSNENCCKLRSSDRYEQIDPQEEVYKQVTREVFEECSQKRYCVLYSQPGSSIYPLINSTVSNGFKLTSLVIEHKCIKEDAFVLSYCVDTQAISTVSGGSLYITKSSLALSPEEYSCTCDIRSGGNTTLTLIDVRLNGNLLTVQGRAKEMLYNFNSTYYGDDLPLHKNEWTLNLSVTDIDLLENAWIKISGNQKSRVEVTCHAPETIPSEISDNRTSNTCGMKADPVYLPFVYFGAGCVVTLAFMGVIVAVYRIVRRKSSEDAEAQKREYYSTADESFTVYSTVDEGETVEPLYSSAIRPSCRLSVSTRGASVSSRKGSFRVTTHYQDEMTNSPDSGVTVGFQSGDKLPNQNPSVYKLTSGSNEIMSRDTDLSDKDYTEIQ